MLPVGRLRKPKTDLHMTETTFQALPLAAPLQRALSEKGYTTPSPVQAQGIPIVLEGRDLLACAQTGTGKTAAFALPMLNGFHALNRKPKPREIRSLVLTPTRELAVQVAESFKTYGKHMPLSVTLVHGGVSFRPQIQSLKRGTDVLVATPGRLLDLVQQGHVDYSGIRCFVLDEADRMLDMGFIRDIRKIAEQLPEERQTLLFSATMAPEVTKLANGLLDRPEEIRIAPQGTTAENIDQRVLFLDPSRKLDQLIAMMERRRGGSEGELSLIFSRTRHGARKLAKKLNQAGIAADSIHGDKTQAARQKTLDRFRDGRSSVLVATDVAARGIDVRNITLVVNYDLPEEAESYVHRIGRTARAGDSGSAVSFCTAPEFKYLRSIERLTRNSLMVETDHEHHDSVLQDRYQSGVSKRGPDKSGRPYKGKGKFRPRSGYPKGKRGRSSARSRN